MNQRKRPVPTRMQRELYDAWTKAGLPWSALGEWCEDREAEFTGDEFEVSAGKIREYVIKFREFERIELEVAATTEYQRQASALGATFAEAVATLGRNLRATTKKVITDRNGNLVDILELDDPTAQINAAKEIIKIQGGYPSDKLAVSINANDPSRMSDEQLQAELAKFLNSGTAQAADAAEGTAGTPSDN